MREFTAPLILLCLIILLSGCSAGNPIQLYQIDSGRTIKMGLSEFLKRKMTIKSHCLSMEASCARMAPRVARRSTGGFHAAHTAYIEVNKAV